MKEIKNKIWRSEKIQYIRNKILQLKTLCYNSKIKETINKILLSEKIQCIRNKIMQLKTLHHNSKIKETINKILLLKMKMLNIGAKNLAKYKLMKQEYASLDKEFVDTEDFANAYHIGRIILWACAIFTILMLLWAQFSVLDEIIIVQGRVIPSSKIQIIQSLEGGIVKDILVKEGEVVAHDQILAKMDDVYFSSMVHEGEIKEFANEIQVLRIEAELNNKPFIVPQEIAEKFPELVAGETDLYMSHQKELKSLNDMKQLLTSELAMTAPLLKVGAVSEVEVLHLHQRLREIDINISRFRTHLLQNLNEARTEKNRLHANNVNLKDRLKRTELRSPVKGIVKQVYVSTVGGVVNPGVPIIEIVPIEDKLLIEAQVKPQDIGFLHIGQTSVVKITAYDSSIYGNLTGKVEHISADTSLDSRGNSFYEIWVRTDKNYLYAKGKKLQIIPGMQVTLHIITGHKSILSYLLKPILKAKDQALRER